jgi:hypothetical protein
MTKKQKYTPTQVVDALKATKGMVYLTAQRLGCDAKTIYNYRDRYEVVRAEMEQQDGTVDDTAELKLFQAIQKGEPWAIQFRLRTKGRNRGYVERQEIDHRIKDVSELSDDELRAIVAAKGSGGT